MTQQTTSEKDALVAALEHEQDTTLRVLRSWPAGRDDFKPAEKSRTARELAWVFVQELRAIDAVLAGKFDAPRPDPPPAGPISEIVSTLEREGRSVIERLGRASAADLDRSMPFPSGPGRMTEQRRMQLVWFMIMDGIHHRGQFSVYLRLVGARVPSIYGPSADEPWS